MDTFEDRAWAGAGNAWCVLGTEYDEANRVDRADRNKFTRLCCPPLLFCTFNEGKSLHE